ncbi:hypothetical protein BD410DRAFT_536266 [Rickenella mellea]|uniref:Uncharacterized protein n=1 Tax=Rickenella mellea TaxID=50990 RepID=A0A4Y7PRG9_9AGAM|nr:hypothetical protein BD410DRAFT_536266 [Rickenella mellea]
MVYDPQCAKNRTNERIHAISAKYGGFDPVADTFQVLTRTTSFKACEVSNRMIETIGSDLQLTAAIQSDTLSPLSGVINYKDECGSSMNWSVRPFLAT